MRAPIELTPDERRCLAQLAAGTDAERSCSRAVLERLQEKGLLDISIQTLPMFPLGRRYRLTPLGEQLTRGLS